MVNIASDRIRAGLGTSSLDRVLRRLLVFVRAHRMARMRRHDLLLIQAEIHDPRWFADIGLDPRDYPTNDGMVEVSRAMGGGL